MKRKYILEYSMILMQVLGTLAVLFLPKDPRYGFHFLLFLVTYLSSITLGACTKGTRKMLYPVLVGLMTLPVFFYLHLKQEHLIYVIVLSYTAVGMGMVYQNRVHGGVK